MALWGGASTTERKTAKRQGPARWSNQHPAADPPNLPRGVQAGGFYNSAPARLRKYVSTVTA
jgi:hypothetical protein